MLPSRAGLLAVLFLSLCACGEPKPDDTATPGIPDGDGDGYVGESDCDDTDPAIHPGAEELCDEVDNDCDGLVDDQDDEVQGAPVWYADSDGDGYAGSATTSRACAAPEGYLADHDDCDDSSADVHPGAEERCNLTDDDCDGRVDDDDDDVTNPTTWYIDLDDDSYGDDDITTAACTQPEGFVGEGGDCDDSDEAFHPGASEDDCTDPNDYDCDGSVVWADADADGWAACEDCDDSDASVNPAADEQCNGVDDDCDGDTDEDDAIDALTWYADADADTYGDANASAAACAQPSGYVADDSDCDDTSAAINPSASELCNSLDDDCDGDTDEDDAVDASTWYADADHDGYGEAATTATACLQPTGYVGDDTDCDDGDDTVNPGADERCGGADEDCDGDIDEDDAVDALTWFADDDGDGFGDAATTAAACTQPSDFVGDDTDCDDTSDIVFPGADEHCDGVDEDCDGDIDEDDAVDALTWFADADGDGFGDAATTTEACTAPSDFVGDATDCDDADDTIFPGADEHCDGVDEDCDGEIDEDAVSLATWYADDDGDGYGDASVTTEACAAPDDFVRDDSDCDDTDDSVHPGADEHCDGVDEDCDGATDEDAVDATSWYADDDADGFGDVAVTTTACTAPDDHVADATDCDDTDDTVHPGADEHCDGMDEDCDGATDEDAVDATTWYADDDADGYGDPAVTSEACSVPDDFVSDATDCDDTDDAVHPGADEHCDGVDEDCDGKPDEEAVDAATWYADLDADGYGDPATATLVCGAPSGFVSDATDCDDLDEDMHPGADEHCDGVDEDCDGTTDEDAVDMTSWYADLDEDGYGDATDATIACAAPSGYVDDDTDCDDLDEDIHPGADEHCDGLDTDCDGTADPAGLVTVIGAADYDDLGDAVAAAVTGATLNVCPGTYMENLVLDRAVTLTGIAGAAGTTVSAESAGSTIMITSGPVALEGLTITGGTGTYDPLLGAYTGGGVLVTTAQPVSLSDCVLTGNEVDDLGGGLYAGLNTDVTLEACELSANIAGVDGGGAYLDQGAYLAASDTLFSANEASYGGGLALSYASADLMDCEVEGNASEEGGGLLLVGDSASLLTLYGTEIHENEADTGGGGLFVAYAPTVQGGWFHDNVAYTVGGGGIAVSDITTGATTGADLSDLVVEGNLAPQGGGIWVYRRANLTSVSVTDNMASDSGGGLYASALSGNTDLVLTLEDSDVSANLAGSAGGGAYLWNAPMESTATTWGTGAGDNDPDDVALDQGAGVAATYGGFDDSGTDFTCDFTTMVCGP